MKTFSTILFCLLSFSIFSQNTVLPIKENGQWGFINDSGTVVLSPRYDAIKFSSTYNGQNLYPYFLVEKNQKFGIVNQRGEVIISALYPKNLELLSTEPLLFKAKTHHQLLVISIDGEEWEDLKTFDDVRFFSKRFLLIEKKGKWGIYDKNKGVIVLPQFDGFAYKHYKLGKDSGFFTFNQKNKQGLVDTLGTVILPPRFDTIINVHSQISMCRVGDEVFQLYNRGDSLGINCVKASYFSDSLVRVQFQNGYNGLLNVSTLKWLTSNNHYTFFRNLSQNQNIEVKKHKSVGRITSLGKEVLAPKYSSIKSFNPSQGIYQYGSNKNWGLVLEGDSILQDSIFEFIGSIKENIGALALKNKKIGLLNVFGQLVLPIEYDEIEINKGKIRAFKRRHLTEYSISPTGQLTEIRQLKNVFTIRAGYKNLVQQQRRFLVSANYRRNRQRPNWNRLVVNSQRNGLVLFQKNNLKGIKDTTTGEIILPAVYSDILRINDSEIAILKKRFDQPQLLIEKIHKAKIEEEVFIFSETSRQIVQSNMVGVRFSDFDASPYAAFIRKDGTFGLLKKDGTLKMTDKKIPFSATFIDQFYYQEPITRVYFGGYYHKIEWMSTNHPNSLGSAGSILKPFDVEYTSGLSDKNLRVMDGRWAYMDTLGQLITAPDFIMAKLPINNKILCETTQGMGVLNEALDTLIPFIYREIKKTDYSNKYWALTKQNIAPVFLSSQGEALQVLSQYDKIMPFTEDLTGVLKDTLWGFINQQYEEVIPCQYRLVRPFSERLAAVRTVEGWHYINKNNEKILSLNPNIRDVGQMKNGMAWFSVGNIFGFSSIDNPLAIMPKFQKVSDFDGDVAVIKEKTGYGIINRNGKYILKPSLKHIKNFNGHKVTAYKKADSRLWGLINRQGQFITDNQFDLIGKFKNGYAKIKKGFLYGLIDSTGKIVIPIEYDELSDWSEGLIAVRPRYQTARYINFKNQVVIDKHFQKIEAFRNGKAIVYIERNRKNEVFVLNKDGSFFYQSNNNQKILHFQEGMLGIKEIVYSDNNRRYNNQFYYKDSLGNVIKDNFIEIQPFQDGLAIIKKKQGFGVIDAAGMYIIDPKYQQIIRLSNGLFKAININHQGLATEDGVIILTPKYDSIKKKGDFLEVKKDARVGYFELEQDWVWEID